MVEGELLAYWVPSAGRARAALPRVRIWARAPQLLNVYAVSLAGLGGRRTQHGKRVIARYY